MLIEKDVDPLAGELFFKYAVPVWDKLTERERKLAAKFVEDPVEGFKEILEYYGFGWRWHFGLLRLFEERTKPLQGMLFEYAEKKGWIYVDKWREKCWIWQRWITVDFEKNGNGTILPRNYWHYLGLKEIKEHLEELKEKGVEEFLVIVAANLSRIVWNGSELRIWDALASEVLGREVNPGDRLSFEEALKVIKWLFDRWEKFMKEVKQKGWVWKDEEGDEHFIWERKITVYLKESVGGNFFPDFSTDPEHLKKIKEALEEVKQKGVEKFLRIFTVPFEKIEWFNDGELFIYYKLASKVIGKWKDLTLEEALKVVGWLYDRWKETKKG